MSWLGGLVGGLAGSLFSNSLASDAAQDSRDYNTWVLQNRYQMTAQDLEKAGLNKILAVNGGLSGTTGSTGMQASTPDVAQGVSSAQQAQASLQRARKENELLEAQRDKLQAETERERTESAYTQAMAEANLPMSNAQYVQSLTSVNQERIGLIRSQIRGIESDISIGRADREDRRRLAILQRDLMSIENGRARNALTESDILTGFIKRNPGLVESNYVLGGSTAQAVGKVGAKLFNEVSDYWKRPGKFDLNRRREFYEDALSR